MSDDRPVLVCDLDESLVEVNTFPLFVPFALRSLVKARHWSAAVSLAAWALSRRLGLRSHRRFKHDVVRLAEQIPAAAVRSWTEDIIDRHVNHEVAERVQQWNGITVLSTAAPEVYAQHIGGLLNFDHVHGSRRTAAGFSDNTGAAKVVRLAERFKLPVDLVITDDAVADAPLIAAGRQVTMVAVRSQP